MQIGLFTPEFRSPILVFALNAIVSLLLTPFDHNFRYCKTEPAIALALANVQSG